MLLVIGLDGASYDLCERWIGEGHLPNLGRIKREGCWRPLQSTTPAVSPVAWSTFMTGEDPGEHGVFGFFVPERSAPHLPPTRFRPVTAHDCHGQRFWERMNEAGLTTGIVGVPVTYPVRPLRGHTIAGLLSPGLRRPGTVYPRGLTAEIEAEVGPYRIVPRGTYYPGAEKAFLKELHATLALRGQLALYLLAHHRCDVHVFVWYETDLVQHKMWQFMDSGHPRHDPVTAKRWTGAILDVYRRADTLVGDLAKRLGPDDTLVVLSDHGAGALHGTVHLNTWLRQQGYLVFRRGYEQWLKRLANKYSFVQHCAGIARLLGITRRFGLSQGARRMLASGLLSRDDIDWAATRAYNLGFEGAIYIVGEQRERTATEIIARLEELRDPTSGQAVVEGAQRGRDVYHGDYAQWAPEVLLRLRGHLYSVSQKAFAPELLGLGADSGTHHPTGIFGVLGAGASTYSLCEVPCLRDVAPFLLQVAGAPSGDGPAGSNSSPVNRPA